MADNRKYYYLKLKENFFDGDSIVLLESMPDGILFSNILMKLYLKSLKNGGKLQLDEHIPYTAQMIATLTRHQIGTVERAIKVFLQLGLVEQLDGGLLYMTDIELMIGQSSTEGERKRAARRKNRALLPQRTNVGHLSDIRPPEIEKEIEIELEEEIDKKTSATEISSYYQKRIGIIDGQQYQILIDYLTLDGMELEVIKTAIDKAADNSKRSFSYINSILKNWRNNGIRTMVQVEDEQRQFRQKKQGQSDNDVQDPFTY